MRGFDSCYHVRPTCEARSLRAVPPDGVETQRSSFAARSDNPSISDIGERNVSTGRRANAAAAALSQSHAPMVACRNPSRRAKVR